MSDKEIILELAQKVNEEYEFIPVNAILAIWCNHKGLPLSTFDELFQPQSEREKISAEVEDWLAEKVLPSIRKTGQFKCEQARNTKTCQHMYIKGQKANTPYKVKVKGDSDYFSKRR